MGLIRSTFSLLFLGLIVLVGLTVPVGERTLFGHVANIWRSDEAQELVEGVKESGEPLVDRVKRGVEAGLTDEVAGGDSGDEVVDKKIEVEGAPSGATAPLASTDPEPTSDDSPQ